MFTNMPSHVSDTLHPEIKFNSVPSMNVANLVIMGPLGMVMIHLYAYVQGCQDI